MQRLKIVTTASLCLGLWWAGCASGVQETPDREDARSNGGGSGGRGGRGGSGGSVGGSGGSVGGSGGSVGGSGGSVGGSGGTGGVKTDAGSSSGGTGGAKTDAGSSTGGDASGGSGGTPGTAMCSTTKLPGKIAGVEPEAHSYHPPVMDGKGALYRVTESVQSDGNKFRMMKSSDGGATWAEVDAARRPSPVDIEGSYQLQVPGAIYLSVSMGHRVAWVRFNTSDSAETPDKWAGDERLDDGLSTSGVKQFSSLARTSDGQFIVAYSDKLTSGGQQIAYKWRTGTNTWGTKVSVDSASGSWTAPRLVMGRGDVAHLFYQDFKARRLLWRKIPKGGTLSEAVRVDMGGTSSYAVPHVHPLVFEKDGKEHIAVAFAGAGDVLKLVMIVDGQVGMEETISSAKVLQNPPIVLNEGAVASLVLQGTTVHAVWTDAATGDIKHRAWTGAGAWSMEKQLWNSGSNAALFLYCGLLTSGNCPRLACAYDVGPHADDIGNIEYREFLLGE